MVMIYEGRSENSGPSFSFQVALARFTGPGRLRAFDLAVPGVEDAAKGLRRAIACAFGLLRLDGDGFRRSPLSEPKVALQKPANAVALPHEQRARPQRVVKRLLLMSDMLPPYCLVPDG